MVYIGDEVAIDQRINQYKSLDYSFPSSRECQFIEKLMTVRILYALAQQWNLCLLYLYIYTDIGYSQCFS